MTLQRKDYYIHATEIAVYLYTEYVICYHQYLTRVCFMPVHYNRTVLYAPMTGSNYCTFPVVLCIQND